MTDDEMEMLVRRAVGEIAPEVDLGEVDAGEDLRDAVGLDSMDVLNLAVVLHRATGVDVPERDYPQIVTIAGCVAYLQAHGG